MDTSERTDTAHRAWDERWRSADGRADWLTPEAEVAALAAELFADGARTGLDLGCGVGRHALCLAALGFETHALDGSRAGLDALEGAAAETGLSVATRQGLMTELPYADAAFDYVLSFNVIYHGAPDIVRAAIAEIARVLKPGGVYQGTMLSKRCVYYGQGREVAPDTFVMDVEDDKAHPHFYCNAAELVTLFDGFELRRLEDRLHTKPGSWHWHLVAERCA